MRCPRRRHERVVMRDFTDRMMLNPGQTLPPALHDVRNLQVLRHYWRCMLALRKYTHRQHSWRRHHTGSPQRPIALRLRHFAPFERNLAHHLECRCYMLSGHNCTHRQHCSLHQNIWRSRCQG